MSAPLLRSARPDEGPLLSALALRSKAHWGYDAAFLEACRGELTYRGEDLDQAVVAELDAVPAGFHLVRGPELVALFVEPDRIGSGLGGVLLRDLLARARARGVEVLRLDADPGAEAFYRHHGAVRVGESPSGSIPGRVLPRLEIRTGGE